MRVLFLAFLTALSAVLDSPAAFSGSLFSGKTITYIVSTKPGGGYDAYGRLIAKYLEKYLPGSTVIVKNIPGAGHQAGAETINASKPDGLTLGTFNLGLIYGQIGGQPGMTVDFGKLSYLGAAATESRVVLVRPDSDFATLADLGKKGRQIRVAVNGKAGTAHIETALLARLLGWNLTPIFGYEGSENEIGLMRGDVDLIVGSKSSELKLVKNGDARIVLEFGGKTGTAMPLMQGASATPEQEALWKLIEFTGRFARITAAPPNLPQAELNELRSAYDAALSDPQLLEEARQSNLQIEPTSGAELATSISGVLMQPTAVVEEIRRMLASE